VFPASAIYLLEYMNDSCESLRKVLKFEVCLLFDLMLEQQSEHGVFAMAYAEELARAMQLAVDVDDWLEVLFWQERLEGSVGQLDAGHLLHQFMPCAKACLEAYLYQLLHPLQPELKPRRCGLQA